MIELKIKRMLSFFQKLCVQQLINVLIIIFLSVKISSNAQIRTFQLGGVGEMSIDSLDVLVKDKVFSYNILFKNDSIQNVTNESIYRKKMPDSIYVDRIDKIKKGNFTFLIYYMPLINAFGDIKPYEKAIIVNKDAIVSEVNCYLPDGYFYFADLNRDGFLDVLLFEEKSKRIYLFEYKSGEFVKRRKFIQLTDFIDDKGRRVNVNASRWKGLESIYPN